MGDSRERKATGPKATGRNAKARQATDPVDGMQRRTSTSRGTGTSTRAARAHEARTHEAGADAQDGRDTQAAQESPPASGPAAAQAAIRAAIRAIPAGAVAAYGVVARRAGLPGRARLVARVLAESGDHDLPWHRVLRADGRVAFPPGSAAFVEQCARLRAEGVQVDARGRVRIERRATSLDEALWGAG